MCRNSKAISQMAYDFSTPTKDEMEFFHNIDDLLMPETTHEFLRGAKNFKDLFEEELNGAPPQFLEAMNYLSTGDFQSAAGVLLTLIVQLKETDPVWAGATACCAAYCLKETNCYKEAVQTAEFGRTCGLNFVGAWYYHDVMDISRNKIDDLQGALLAANEAIDFFKAPHKNLWVVFGIGSLPNPWYRARA